MVSRATFLQDIHGAHTEVMDKDDYQWSARELDSVWENISDQTPSLNDLTLSFFIPIFMRMFQRSRVEDVRFLDHIFQELLVRESGTGYDTSESSSGMDEWSSSPLMSPKSGDQRVFINLVDDSDDMETNDAPMTPRPGASEEIITLCSIVLPEDLDDLDSRSPSPLDPLARFEVEGSGSRQARSYYRRELMERQPSPFAKHGSGFSLSRLVRPPPRLPIVLAPLYHAGHWSLAVYFPSTRSWHHYDSYVSRAPHRTTGERVHAEYANRFVHTLALMEAIDSAWLISPVTECPRALPAQKDDWECGFYVLLYCFHVLKTLQPLDDATVARCTHEEFCQFRREMRTWYRTVRPFYEQKGAVYKNK